VFDPLTAMVLVNTTLDFKTPLSEQATVNPVTGSAKLLVKVIVGVGA
jgi:hypothetical protein